MPWMEGEEGREVKSRQNIQGLTDHSKLGDFMLTAPMGGFQTREGHI